MVVGEIWEEVECDLWMLVGMLMVIVDVYNCYVVDGVDLLFYKVK